MKYRKYKDIEGDVKEDERPIIMIVDDEPGILKELETLLLGDYRIITAGCAQEALEKLQGSGKPEEFSLIICDQRMPGMSGIELLKKLVHNQIMPDTTRIMLTAVDDKEVILDSINEAHIYKYIMKPYDPDALLLDVRRAVESFYDRNTLAKKRDVFIVEKNEKIREMKKEFENLTDKYNELSRKWEGFSLPVVN